MYKTLRDIWIVSANSNSLILSSNTCVMYIYNTCMCVFRKNRKIQNPCVLHLHTLGENLRGTPPACNEPKKPVKQKIIKI